MESSNDAKKRLEQQCIDDVLNAAKYQHGKSKHILELLSGEEITRPVKECPDFVKYCSTFNGKDRNFILGVEHFQVDHHSFRKQKDGKMSANTLKFRKDIATVQRRWKDSVIGSKEIPTGAIDDLCSLLTQGLQNKYSASYHDFIHSFQHSLFKHLEKAPYYYQNIKAISTKYKVPVKLMLLIEVYSDFKNLFLNSGKKYKLVKDWVPPIFEDIIQLLESIDSKQFQYIVLCLRDIPGSSKYSVIALQTCNIRKNLAQQHIQVYHYIGKDYYLEDFYNQRENIKVGTNYAIDKDNSKIDIFIQSSFQQVTPEYKVQLVFKAFLDAIKFAKQREAFITTPDVQCLFEIFGSACLYNFSQLNEDNILYTIQQIAYTHQISYIEEAENFYKEWGINGKNDQII